MLLARDGFGGLGVFGAGYTPKPSTATTSTSTGYTPQPSTSERRYTAAELQAQYVAFLNAWTDSQRIEEFGLAPKLPACPPTSLSERGGCFTGAAPNILPAGTFVLYGTPFNIGEFRKGEQYSFLKTFKPNAIQREVIEYFIRKRSAQVFGKLLGQAIVARRLPWTQSTISINQARSLVPGFTVTIRGLKYKPIIPRPDEYEQAGGLAAWLARGGFPLIEGVADGTISQDEAFTPIVCQSILCRCPSATTKPISCVRAYVTKDGLISQQPKNDLATFWVFIKVDSNDTITLALDYDEPSKLERVGNAMASLFEGLGKMLCMAAPAAKEQMAAMTLPKCVDKDNKPCKQGAAGCKCVTPPDTTAVAVGTTNVVMSKWCEGWNKEYAPGQEFPVDILPPPDVKPFPWAWVIGGLAIAGGIAYASRR